MYLGLRKILRQSLNRELPRDGEDQRRETNLDRTVADIMNLFGAEIDRLRREGEALKVITEVEADVLEACAESRQSTGPISIDRRDRNELVRAAARYLKNSTQSGDRYGDILSAVSYLMMELEAIARIQSEDHSPKPKQVSDPYRYRDLSDQIRQSVGIATPAMSIWNAATSTGPATNRVSYIDTTTWRIMVDENMPTSRDVTSAPRPGDILQARVSGHQTPPVERVQAQREAAEQTNRDRVEAMRAALRRRSGDIA